MPNKFDVSIEGLGRLIVKLERMDHQARQDTKRSVRLSTGRIQANARRKARDQKVQDTGHLIRSIKGSILNNGFTGEVVGGADYHVYHELGTRKTPARPMLFPAALEEKELFYKRLRDAIRRGAVGR